MRLCYDQRETSDDALVYKEELKERFSEEKMYANFVRQVEEACNPMQQDISDGLAIL